MVWAGDEQSNVIHHMEDLSGRLKEEAFTYINAIGIPHPWLRSICFDDRSIGFVFIFQGSGDDRCRAQIGYAIAVKYWGQGIATRAVKIALDQLSKDLPVLRLQAYVVDNKASKRVLEKAGFLQDGTLRKYIYFKGRIVDLYSYSFLSPEPDPIILIQTQWS